MEKEKKVRKQCALAWLLIACLTMTTTAPAAPVFAAEAHETTGGERQSGSARFATESDSRPEENLPTATGSDAEEGVCEVDGTPYETVQEAVDEIGSGRGKVTLLQDVWEKVITVDKGKVTIDLGGYTLTGKVDTKGGAEVTLRNGTVDSGKGYCVVYASGNDATPTKLTLEEDAVLTAQDYGLLICGVTGSKDHNGIGYSVLIDGRIEATSEGGSGIWLHGNMSNESATVCDVVVNGTVETGMADGPGIAVNGWGHVTVNEGALVSGVTGVEVRAGSLTVNGGTISGVTEYFEDYPNGNGSTSEGAGIMVNGHTTNLPIRVNINGGEITGHYALAQDNTQKKNNKTAMTVTGGTFTGYNEDCALYLANYGEEGCDIAITGGTFMDGNGRKSDIGVYLGVDYAQDDDGGVMTADSLFKIGDTYFSGFQDVIDAALNEPGEVTITMVGDMENTTPVTIAEEQALTMNLAGHSLTMKDDSSAGLRNQGSLTLSGEGTIRCEGTAVANEGSSLTIDEGVTIVSTGSYAIANVSGSLVSSGNVVSEGSAAIASFGGEVLVDGGTVQSLTGSAVYAAESVAGQEAARERAGRLITITGGTFLTGGKDCVVYDGVMEAGGELPVVIFCGAFSNGSGLAKFYAGDKTKGSQSGEFFEVYTYDKEEVVNPSCVTGGSTTYACVYCGSVFPGEVTAPLGHDWGEWKTTKKPTLTEAGEESRFCGRCKEKESRTVGKTGSHVTVVITDREGQPAEGVRFRIVDEAGNQVGETFTRQAETDLLKGSYTVRITIRNGYTFNTTEVPFTAQEDKSLTIAATNTQNKRQSGHAGGSGSGGLAKGSAAAGNSQSGSWEEDLTGWRCRKSDGSFVQNDWAELDYNGRTDWYYFGADGYMSTGWLGWNGKTYYLSPEADGTKGHMVTGWRQIGDNLYYFGADGALVFH